MDKNEILSKVIDIHNNLLEISVKGEDAIRLATIIQKCRSLVYEMQKEESSVELGDSVN